MSVFTATHGVEFRDADDVVWAKFVLDDESTELVNGVTRKRYRFETDDPAVAARLRDVDDYGITEVDPEVEADDKPKPEPPAGNASREAWAQFLVSQGIDFPADPDAPGGARNDLRELWKAKAQD